ncbi:MAG: ABC transporter ATP-binding protein [Micrococcus sp.]|nr:ABC transporter ATP-binding protein [Micrococcus sp.]
MLEIRNVSKTFFPNTVNERKALRDVSLSMAEGDFVTVIGSNGAGKSTILNTVAGKLTPDVGSVSVGGKDVTRMKDYRRAQWIGRVFQDPTAGTAPNLTIQENMALAWRRGHARALALSVTGSRKDLFRTELKKLELGLENRLTTKVGLLSGGQRQALSLLMATFSGPQILLLDEHTAALDPSRAELVTRLTQQVVAEHRLTTLMVTHNMQQALDVGNRLIMMHDGQIILELDEEQKQRMTAQDLLAEFAKIKGAVVDDKTMLQ